MPIPLTAELGRFCGTLIMLVFGAYLFLHAHGIGAWWRRRRQHLLAAAATPQEPAAQCPECGTPYDPADYRDDIDSNQRRCSRCRAVLPANAE